MSRVKKCLGTTEKQIKAYIQVPLGDSRKHPYHTTGGILEFRGRGGVSWTGIPKVSGGNAVWNSKGMGRGGFQL